jgi:hypothetical protein
MEINTTTAFASAAISAIFGFGLAFPLGKIIFKNQASKTLRAISSIASISLGYGLMGVANELIGFPLQGLSTRIDKIVNYTIVNIAIIPIVCWIIYLIAKRNNEKSTAQTFNVSDANVVTPKSFKTILFVSVLSIAGWILLSTMTKPGIPNEKNNNPTNTNTTSKGTSTPQTKSETDKICRFVWNENSGTFTALTDDIKDMDSYTNTVIPKTARTEYINSLIPQLRDADKKGNDTLAREIAKEIRRNSITVYFSKSLSPEFIQTLASSRNIELQCN